MGRAEAVWEGLYMSGGAEIQNVFKLNIFVKKDIILMHNVRVYA